jgi:hypothetical protein
MDKDKLRQLIWDEQMQSSMEYCVYCGQAKYRRGCCGENHYQTFAEMDKEDQNYIVDELLEDEMTKESK